MSPSLRVRVVVAALVACAGVAAEVVPSVVLPRGEGGRRSADAALEASADADAPLEAGAEGAGGEAQKLRMRDLPGHRPPADAERRGARLLDRVRAAAADPVVRWDPTDVRITQPDARKRQREVSVAIDPRDPDVVVAGAMDYGWEDSGRAWSAYPVANRAFLSRDGGRSWASPGFEAIPASLGETGTASSDPALAFDREGVAHLVGLVAVMDPRRVIRLQDSRSVDGGLSWTAPTGVVGWALGGDGTDRYPDKELIAADPGRPGYLYVAYTAVRADPSTGEISAAVSFTASADGGRTWRTPTRVAPPDEAYGIGATPFVTADGVLHVAYFAALPTPPADGCGSVFGGIVYGRPSAAAIVVATSRDAGQSWTREVTRICEAYRDVTVTRPHVEFSFPAVAVDDRTGRVIVAWAGREDATDDARVIRAMVSGDDARSFSTPRTIAAEGDADTIMPAIAAGAGRVVLTYVATVPGGAYDVRARASGNAGRTWHAPVRLTTRASPAPQPDAFPDIGDYNSVALAAGRVVAAWTDLRDGLTTRIYARAGTLRGR